VAAGAGSAGVVPDGAGGSCCRRARHEEPDGVAPAVTGGADAMGITGGCLRGAGCAGRMTGTTAGRDACRPPIGTGGGG